MTFFCGKQKRIFWKMCLYKVSAVWSNAVQTFFKICCMLERKSLVWNDMRVTK